MALLTSELTRVKYELGYNTLDAGAEPYISVVAVFDQIIQTYLESGAATTSATAVTAAAAPTPVTLTLASATGFNAGDRVVIDIDSRQEFAHVQSITGNDIVVLLRFDHTGTYPVTVEGGESIVREILTRLYALGSSLGELAVSTAGIKRVDEIEFFGDATINRIEQLTDLRMKWRDELAGCLGVVNMWRARAGASQIAEVY